MSTYEIGDGRGPPPPEHRFKPGQSGNPRGRPKGAISKKLLTRKVMLRRVTREVNGKRRSLSLVEMFILKLRSMHMEGDARATALLDQISAKLEIPDSDGRGGFVLVPELLTSEEAEVQIARYNADHPHEPGTPEYEKYGR